MFAIIVGSFGWRLAAILGLPLKIIIHVYPEGNHYVSVIPALPNIFGVDDDLDTLINNTCNAAMTVLIENHHYMGDRLDYSVIQHKYDDDVMEI